MKKDTIKTDVIFRKFKEGDIIALMPHEVCTYSGEITSYMHVGQHSSANYNECLQITRLCRVSEYNELKKELESLGYNLNVIKKQNHAKWLKSYESINKIR